jgi:hypothetical protein
VRYTALNGFYTGPVWQAHRDAARETMIDTDNVLELRPLTGAVPAVRQPVGGGAASSLILATIHFPAPGADEALARHFGEEVAPQLRDIQAAPLATFATNHAPNSYPNLPVRDETVFVTLTQFASVEAYAAREGALRRIEGPLNHHLVKPTEFRRLQPTARSPLR